MRNLCVVVLLAVLSCGLCRPQVGGFGGVTTPSPIDQNAGGASTVGGIGGGSTGAGGFGGQTPLGGAGGAGGSTPEGLGGASPAGLGGATTPSGIGGAGASSPSGLGDEGVTPGGAGSSGGPGGAGSSGVPGGFGGTSPSGGEMPGMTSTGAGLGGASGSTPAGGFTTSGGLGGSSTAGGETGGSSTSGEGSTPAGGEIGGSTPTGGETGGSTGSANGGTTPSPGGEGNGVTGAAVENPTPATSNNGNGGGFFPMGAFYSACKPDANGPAGTFTCRFTSSLSDLEKESAPVQGNKGAEQNNSPSNGGGLTTPSSPGSSKAVEANIACIKAPSSNGSLPGLSLLKDTQNKAVKVAGTWSDCKSADGNTITLLSSDSKTYSDVLNQCKSKGFETAQPLDQQHQNFNAFNVDNQITEHYHQQNGQYKKEPQGPSDKC